MGDSDSRLVFLASAASDEEDAATLAGLMRNQGWSVFKASRETEIEAIEDMIEKTLLDSQCVVVLWSTTSQTHPRIRIQAEYAEAMGRLVSARLDTTPLPDFAMHHSAFDLTHRPIANNQYQLTQLFKTIETFVTSPGVSLDETGPKSLSLSERVARRVVDALKAGEDLKFRQQRSSAFRINNWTIFPDRNLIMDGDIERRLTPKAMAVLALLAETPGRTVTKQELFRNVWDGAIVGDDVLYTIVAKLRATLAHSHEEQIIETIPKKGYRLVPQRDLETEPQTQKHGKE